MLGTSTIFKNDAGKPHGQPPRPRRRSRFRWTARRRKRAVSVVEFLLLCAAIVMASLLAAGRVTFPSNTFVELATTAAQR
jgi:hypothetical protein